ATCRSLPAPHRPRGGAADCDGAECLRWQPDPRRRTARAQPQYPAQEDPDAQHRDRQAVAPSGIAVIGGSRWPWCHILATFVLKGGTDWATLAPRTALELVL